MLLFNQIIDIINNICIGIISFAFTFQIIYLFLFFLKSKKYPISEIKYKCGIIISARDEENIIGRTIKQLQNANYPKDKYEIIVMADNCIDNTARICRELSGEVKVRVVERNELDKKKHCVGWALNYLFDAIKDDIKNFDFFIRFDADDLVDPDYISKMNDAYASGVKAAKGYNHASNLTQNIISGVSGLWYIRDNRFNCQARNALGTDVFMVGGGMMFAASSIIEDGGWICTHRSEDTEFTILNMFKKRKVGYVSEAIVYEDQPSTIKDIFRRNIRMGNALHNLFWTKGWSCLFKFFTTFRYCFLDMFLNLFFIPIAVICCTWIPFYYIYSFLFNLLNPLGDITLAYTILKGIIIALVFAFIIPFIGQAFLVYFLDKKKINTPLSKLLPTILSFPMFMIIYALSIFIGVISLPQWKKPKRNIEYKSDIIKQIENKQIKG